MKRKKSYIFLFLSLCLILYAFIDIFLWINDNNKNKELQQKLKNLAMMSEQYFCRYDEFISQEENNIEQDVDFLQVDFIELKNINDDTIGWLQVANTSVDYPVVQGEDNEYYLMHSFDNSQNNAGWIFLDARNDINNFGRNTVIYGHSRVDDTMFGSLRYVLDEDWYNNSEHIIKLATLNANTIWQIISVYSVPSENYYIKTNFLNDGLFQNFLDNILSRSKFNFSTNVDINDKILTLSTCRDNYGNRLVIHAKLVKSTNN